MRFAIGENFSEAVTVVAPVHMIFDDTPNDSDKSFVVPNGETWKLNFAHIIFASTADVGNRQMEMVITNEDGGEILSVVSGVVQGASLSRDYHFIQGTFREGAFISGEIQTPFGIDVYLLPGWSIRFRDSAAIAASADDMTVAIQALRFKGV